MRITTVDRSDMVLDVHYPEPRAYWCHIPCVAENSKRKSKVSNLERVEQQGHDPITCGSRAPKGMEHLGGG